MNKFFTFLCCTIILLGFTGAASAMMIFEDDFDNINVTGTGGLNYNSFTNWNVSSGTVDVIGEGTNWNFFPGQGYGKYIDMDGSTNNAGKMKTVNNLLNLDAGHYVLSFDLAGNQRRNEKPKPGKPDDKIKMGVKVGNWTQQVFSREWNDGFSTEFYSFTLSQSTKVKLSFTGIGKDNVGMLLDNVKLYTNPVPEPTTMALFGAGLLALPFIRRKMK